MRNIKVLLTIFGLSSAACEAEAQMRPPPPCIDSTIDHMKKTDKVPMSCWNYKGGGGWQHFGRGKDGQIEQVKPAMPPSPPWKTGPKL